jgi:hypothetical protein
MDPLAQARQLCEEAAGLQRQGHLRSALDRYRRAYALVPTPVILLREAKLHRDLGEADAAQALLRRINPHSLPPELRREHTGLQRHLLTLRTPRWVQAGPVAAPAQAPAPGAPRAGVPPTTGDLQRSAPVRQTSGLRIAKWLLGAAGVTAVVAGAVVWSMDGAQSCTLAPGQVECPRLHDTRALGIGLVSGGLATMATSAVLFGIDAGRGERRSFVGYQRTF